MLESLSDRLSNSFRNNFKPRKALSVKPLEDLFVNYLIEKRLRNHFEILVSGKTIIQSKEKNTNGILVH